MGTELPRTRLIYGIKVLRPLVAVIMFLVLVVGEVLFTTSRASADPALIVRPGDEIGTNSSNGSMRICTLGFLTMTSDPTPAFLTAGHCAPKTGMPVFWNPDGSKTRRVMGYTRVIQYSGEAVGSTDIALIDVSSGTDFSKSSVLTGGVAISGVSTAADLQRYNPILCKQGYISGNTCGHITKFFGSDKLTFDAKSDHGDSGSPVYAVWPDGTYTAVGILNGSPVSNDDSAVVQLIAPWMSSWALRLAG